MTGNRGVESPSHGHRIHPHDTPHFHSTVSERKLHRFNYLIFVLRLAAFCFSLSAVVFMIATKSDTTRWYDFAAFRFVVAANGIVTLYSLFEMVASAWEITRGSTVFPEFLQVWFDFGHDQVFAYLLLSADSAGTEMAMQLRRVATCNAFCVQSDIAVGLGFVGFLFLMMSSLLSGFRVVCFIIKGSRYHV
ncbi:CASP-like protein 4C1 [Bidens hawaiensis]|uniref:CASP-like protein 4C1 n=1 Tax=Bidens hawaiensis TaxID=980011 RepID=UPI004049C1EB